DAHGAPLTPAGSQPWQVAVADGRSVAVEQAASGEEWVWRAGWERACDHDPAARFALQAVVCNASGACHVGLEVSLARPGAPLAPLRSVGFRAPRLAAILLERHPSLDAGHRLRAQALHLRNTSDVEALSALLHASERTRPVIYCSAAHRRPRVDADRLAVELAGLAHITYATEPAIDDALKASLPDGLAVWGGAIRIYYPGLRDGLEHPVIAGDDIRRAGEGVIRGRLLRDLSRLACATMTTPPAVDAIRQQALAERQQTADQPRAAGERHAGDLLAEHEQTLSELDVVRELNSALERSLEDHRGLAERQARQIADLSRHLAESGQSRSACDDNADDTVERRDEPPRTVVAAVELARREARHLLYAPAALESAAELCFGRPGELLEDLRRLDQLAAAYLRPDGIGMTLAEHARQLGLQWRGGVSNVAVGQHPDQYTIRHNDRRLTVGPHVIVGQGPGQRCARIYLVAHPGDTHTARGLIVARICQHLPDRGRSAPGRKAA
ncbi:MAG: hypothetical protein ABSG43_12225, partial [Solirubrobacteraceae bacterium]